MFALIRVSMTPTRSRATDPASLVTEPRKRKNALQTEASFAHGRHLSLCLAASEGVGTQLAGLSVSHCLRGRGEFMFLSRLKAMALVCAGFLTLSPVAQADVFQTFNITWSGANEGASSSSATATATMTLDLSTLPDTSNLNNITSSVTAFSITVTGSSGGDGTFSLSSYDIFQLWTPGEAGLNLQQPLLGQIGDFDIFPTFTDLAPFTIDILQIGPGDYGLNGIFEPMGLVSFSAVSPVSTPEPASIAIFGGAFAGLGFLRRRRRNV